MSLHGSTGNPAPRSSACQECVPLPPSLGACVASAYLRALLHAMQISHGSATCAHGAGATQQYCNNATSQHLTAPPGCPPCGQSSRATARVCAISSRNSTTPQQTHARQPSSPMHPPPTRTAPPDVLALIHTSVLFRTLATLAKHSCASPRRVHAVVVPSQLAGLARRPTWPGQVAGRRRAAKRSGTCAEGPNLRHLGDSAAVRPSTPLGGHPAHRASRHRRRTRQRSNRSLERAAGNVHGSSPAPDFSPFSAPCHLHFRTQHRATSRRPCNSCPARALPHCIDFNAWTSHRPTRQPTRQRHGSLSRRRAPARPKFHSESSGAACCGVGGGLRAGVQTSAAPTRWLSRGWQDRGGPWSEALGGWRGQFYEWGGWCWRLLRAASPRCTPEVAAGLLVSLWRAVLVSAGSIR
eukprot:350554-Chlamydomonas_euryale.AAC.4